MRPQRRSRAGSVFALVACAALHAQSQSPPRLELPVACRLNEDCWLVNHVDLDPTGGRRDYRCGAMTYDGHKGTDIGIVHGGVDRLTGDTSVLAAAAGTVRGTRDGMADTGLSGNSAAQLQGRECGNGVVIAHDDGWTTQYCHLRQGSVTVRTGQRVAAGAKIGDVGMSGMAAFPHVHFQVTKSGRVIDPFVGTPEHAPDSCSIAATTLWSDRAQAVLTYPGGRVVSAAWQGTQPADDPVSATETPLKERPSAGPAYFRVVFLGVSRGDTLTLEVKNAAGLTVAKNRRQAERTQIRVSLWVRVPQGVSAGDALVGQAMVESAGTLHKSAEWTLGKPPAR